MQSPTTAAAFDCLCRHKRGDPDNIAVNSAHPADVRQTQELNCCEKRVLSRYLVVFSTKSTVPRRFFCTRTNSFFKGDEHDHCSTCPPCRQKSSKFSTALHNDIRVRRASPPRVFHRAPQRHPRNTCQPPTSHVPSS